MKKTITAIAFLAILIGGYFGYQHYKAKEFVKELHSPIKEVTLRIKSLAEDTLQPGQITYREYADKAENTVKSAEEALLKVESMDSSANPQAAEAAITYLKQAREFSRSLRGMNQADLKANAEFESYKNATESYMKSLASDYSSTYAKERHDKASADMKKAMAELKESGENGKASLLKFLAANKSTAEKIPSELLLGSDTAERLTKYFDDKESDKSKDEKKEKS